MSDDRWREVDDQLGRVAGSKPARVLGWLAVAAWVGFVAWQLAPYVLP